MLQGRQVMRGKMTVQRVKCHLGELKTYNNVVVCTNCNIIIVAQSIALPLLLYLVGTAVAWRVPRLSVLITRSVSWSLAYPIHALTCKEIAMSEFINNSAQCGNFKYWMWSVKQSHRQYTFVPNLSRIQHVLSLSPTLHEWMSPWLPSVPPPLPCNSQFRPIFFNVSCQKKKLKIRICPLG